MDKPNPPPSLHDLQRWVLGVISDPAGIHAGASNYEGTAPGSIAEVIRPSSAMESGDRLHIYHFMYFARLVEILEEEYPTVVAILGEGSFDTIARLYLRAHPSSHYSLSQLSLAFPGFLRGADLGVSNQSFLADIATVERAMEDTFDAPGGVPLGAETFAEVSPAQWPEVRLELTDALTLLALDHPVNDVISAVRDGKSPSLPPAEPSYVAVHRTDWQVWRTDLSAAEFLLLGALRAGRCLGEALRESHYEGDDLFGFFAHWRDEGIFTGLDLPR